MKRVIIILACILTHLFGERGDLISFEYFVSLPISFSNSYATNLIVDKGVLNECAAAAA